MKKNFQYDGEKTINFFYKPKHTGWVRARSHEKQNELIPVWHFKPV